ncbi:MAG: holo-[acyl-carrier-protein] synthase [Planctomycetaceae bacterium]|nr:MAG: holo-[acyl-carrier-protein] synthase [Planctomycetaceae bacterium]
MIAGIGIDIVEVERIRQVIARHGEHFLERIYTADEICYCGEKRESAQHFAGRWAAKEAVMKVLGTGFVRGIGFRDIEVKVKPSGEPYVVLHEGVARFAQQRGITQVWISLSHCRSHAVALAIGWSGSAGEPPFRQLA